MQIKLPSSHKPLLLSALFGMVALGCLGATMWSCSKSDSGGGGSHGGKGDKKNTASGQLAIVADPYIEGATFCIDANKDYICQDSEVESTASNASGEVRFPEETPPVAGDVLVMNTPGEHVGFDVETVLSRVVGEAPEADTPIIINPMTTLLASGWTENQVLEVLQTAGLTGITADDLYKNPMEGIESLDQTTVQESDLENIQAAIATQAFVQVLSKMNSSSETKKVTHDMFTALPTAQGLINNMVAQVKRNLSKDLLTSIDTQMGGFQAQMSQCPSAMPKATIGLVLRVSVSINEYIIPKVVEDPTYAPSDVNLAKWGPKLGFNYYWKLNATNMCISMALNNPTIKAMISASLPSGYSLPDVTCKAYRIANDAGDITCVR